MTPHQLGKRLREQVQSDRRAGRPFDPRRLQAVIGDLCGGDHPELVAPLRYLVLSAPFASAAGQDPPFADARLLPRLAEELAQMMAAPVCQQLQPVLEGLVGMPERPLAYGTPPQGVTTEGGQGGGRGPSPTSPWGEPAAGATGGMAHGSADGAGGWPPAGAAIPPQAPPQSSSPKGGQTLLNVVLAFSSGVLLILLGTIGLVLWQRQRSPEVSTAPAPSRTAAAPETAPVAPASPPPATPPQAPSPPAANPPEANSASVAPVDRAVAGIQELYSALSAKDFDQARSRFGSAAADQFDEGFFRQFERVSVQDLRSTSQSGNTVNLEGLVTFVWPDGTIQTETRTFSVDTSSEPSLITASEFGRVVKAR